MRRLLESFLSTTTVTATPVESKKNLRKSLIMVSGCTVLGAAAQILIKLGLSNMGPVLQDGGGSLLAQAPAVLLIVMLNFPLMGGLALYGLSSMLLILALRYGELSLLYPVIALTYVWVAVLSVMIFHESMPPVKLVGLATIVIGVAILGTGGNKS
jgi:multidrug transporter EmrE-like cation transporter